MSIQCEEFVHSVKLFLQYKCAEMKFFLAIQNSLCRMVSNGWSTHWQKSKRVIIVRMFKGRVITHRMVNTPKYNNHRSYLVRSTAAVVSILRKDSLRSSMVWVIFHPKTLESEKLFKQLFIRFEGWYPIANAAARDAVGTRCHLVKHTRIQCSCQNTIVAVFSQVDNVFSWNFHM